MNKPKTPAGFQPKVVPAQQLTEEQKKAKIMQFVQQKREAFALTIMGGLCSNPELFRQEVDAKTLAGMAVKTADALLEKLYSLEEKEK